MFSRQVQGTISTARRHTVVIEDLERAADISYPLEEILQLLHCHLLNSIILPVVEPMSCKRWELGALREWGIVVKIDATVG